METRQGTRFGAVLAVLAQLWTGTVTAATLAAGGYHSCAIGEPAGDLSCWGLNASGQLGNIHAVDRAAPVAVISPISRWRAVAAGNEHTCAIATEGTVFCWGSNEYGQLGDGTLTDRSAPVPVAGLTGVVDKIALGSVHSCALMHSGRVNCWGHGEFGRLGSGQTTTQTTPGEVLTITDAVDIGAGAAHTCAVLADDTMKCWGWNVQGAIGDGTNTTRPTPVSVAFAPGVAVSDITLGQHHTCARDSSTGAALCWGRNNEGQIGDGSVVTERFLPVAVSGLSSGVTALSAGALYTCARIGSSGVKCWGANTSAQLGNGTLSGSRVPVDVITLVAPIGEVAGGAEHHCVRSGGGDRVRCWGNAVHGRTAVGNTLPDSPGYSTQAVTISGLPAPARHLSLLAGTSCAVTATGRGSCWGRNDVRQLGAGSIVDHSAPRGVVGQADVSGIAIGRDHGCALRSDGTVWCWGDNTYGQIGDQTTIARPIAVQTVGLTSAVQIAAGLAFTCVRTAEGAVWCWGRNLLGHLGDGTTMDRTQPVPVIGLNSGIVDISLGDRHACAVHNDGTVYCWGHNNGGQLGDGSFVDRSVPTAMSDASVDYVAVAAGTVHTCGVTTAGQAKCWGGNTYGQLGDGSTTTRSGPAAVATLTTGVQRIAAGDFHNCALLSGGSLRCWGYNNRYQLGDDTQINRLQPVSATNVTGTVLGMELGMQATCVLRAGDSAQCWGLNNYDVDGDGDIDSYGQLGNGSIVSWRLPQEIARSWLDDRIFSDDFEL